MSEGNWDCGTIAKLFVCFFLLLKGLCHGNRSLRYKSFRYKAVSIHGVSIETQQVKLHKNVVHFKYSLRVNKKNMLGEYPRSLSQVMWNDLHLEWINFYRNGWKHVSRLPRSFCCYCQLHFLMRYGT